MLDIVTQLVVYLLTISVASERLTEILKRTFVKTLIETLQLSTQQQGAVYQIISGLFGAFACWVSPPNLGSLHMNEYLLISVIGLAVSGGSGAWNSALEFLKQVVDAKKINNENSK